MKKAQKKDLGVKYRAKAENSAAMIVAEYRGLTVAQISRLRAELRKEESDLKVVKNRVMKKALDGTPMEGLIGLLTGPVAIAFHADDPVAPAKVLVDFAKDHEALKIMGAVVDNQVMDEAQAKTLAKLPGKKELQSSIVGQINSVMGVVSFAINDLLGEIVGLVEAQEKALGGGAEAEAA